jgi:hypothetical protein
LVGIATDSGSNAHAVGDQNDTDPAVAGAPDGVGRFWLTPPDVSDRIKQEFGEYWDACPYPLPSGHDALAMPWPEDASVVYVNAPFSKMDELHGRSLIEFARRVIAEHKKGKTVLMAMPSTDAANLLFTEGAEARSLGRCAWVDPDTG